LGSLAFSDPYAIVQLQKEFSPERVIVALDHRDGVIMVEGWTSSTSVSLEDAIKEYASLGARSFLITSITKDGTLTGPDLDVLEDACQYSRGGVIAAGGIGTLQDLLAIKKVGADAAVVGKALYEGKFTLREAIAAVQGEQ
jgi:phosphoribosylformimino-5-aminoimidazole carboxamide ribotide isomerase